VFVKGSLKDPEFDGGSLKDPEFDEGLWFLRYLETP
jgi:hypothetical protein